MLLATITILQIICSIKCDRFENVQETSISDHQPEGDGVTDTDQETSTSDHQPEEMMGLLTLILS